MAARFMWGGILYTRLEDYLKLEEEKKRLEKELNDVWEELNKEREDRDLYSFNRR